MLGLARTLAHLKVSVWCEQKNITLKAISILYSRGEGKDPEVLVFIMTVLNLRMMRLNFIISLKINFSVVKDVKWPHLLVRPF